MNGTPPVIRVVDDDPSFRVAVGRMLRAAGFAVREYPSAGDYLLAESGDEPGCILLDLRMPGPSGLDLQATLVRSEHPLPVVFLTAHGDVPLSVRAMKAGAQDFLGKPVKKETLLEAIRAALVRNGEMRTAHAELRVLRARYETLSGREREVLAYVVSGRLNKQIASKIGAAERTVKAHRARVMEKMCASSVADLVRFADRLGPEVREIVPTA